MNFKSIIKSLSYLIAAVAFSAAHAGSYEDFFHAVQMNDAGAVTKLIQRGFDPNTRDEKGQVGLFLAVRGDSFGVADALLSSPQVDVNAANPAGETPLMIAAIRGLTDWEGKLIAHGAKAQQAGWSPVLYAASGPEPKALAYLLDQGASANSRSPNGTTPLMMAARYGSPDSVKLLLDRGADPKLQNDLHLSAADFAKAAGRDSLSTQLIALSR